MTNERYDDDMRDDHEDALFDPYEEAMRHEFNSRYDDMRERYGDPCPRHGTLRWQGDCPDCEWFEHDGSEQLTLPFDREVPASEIFLSDDDIPF